MGIEKSKVGWTVMGPLGSLVVELKASMKSIQNSIEESLKKAEST